MADGAEPAKGEKKKKKKKDGEKKEKAVKEEQQEEKKEGDAEKKEEEAKAEEKPAEEKPKEIDDDCLTLADLAKRREEAEKALLEKKMLLAEKLLEMAEEEKRERDAEKRKDKDDRDKYDPSTYVPPPDDVDIFSLIDEDKLQEFQEAFNLLDLNQDGLIDKADLEMTFMTLGKLITDDEIQTMLSEAPSPLDFEGFVVLLGHKAMQMECEEVLKEALSKWDYEGKGYISEERLKHDLMCWGDRFTSHEVDVAFEDAPIYSRNGEWMLNYIEFCRMLSGVRKKNEQETAATE